MYLIGLKRLPYAKGAFEATLTQPNDFTFSKQMTNLES